MFIERAIPEYTAEQRAIRAEQAKRLLADPFFLSIMEESENEVIRKWLQSTDPAARERAHQLCGGLYTIMATLRSVVDEGTLDSTPTGA